MLRPRATRRKCSCSCAGDEEVCPLLCGCCLCLSLVVWRSCMSPPIVRISIALTFRADVETPFGYLQEGRGYSCRLSALVWNFHHLDIRSSASKSHCGSTSCGHRKKKHGDREGSSSTCDQKFVVSRTMTNKMLRSSFLLFSSCSQNYKCNSATDSRENHKGQTN